MKEKILQGACNDDLQVEGVQSGRRALPLLCLAAMQAAFSQAM